MPRQDAHFVPSPSYTRCSAAPSRRPSQPRNSSISSSLSRSPIFVKTSVSSSADTLPSCQGPRDWDLKRKEKKVGWLRGRHGRRGTRQYGEAHFVGVEDPKGELQLVVGDDAHPGERDLPPERDDVPQVHGDEDG